ncbi:MULTISPECIES: MFS transporter [Halorubrum]|uniref:MFS transporter n=1 Tax=Halorubrum TaxID=56688 RepID=UPI000B859405|nr:MULTISPECIES: MFS transporter [Halorubrum]TKX55797.1 MFS transporter [Halorubrum sp. SP3]TKX71422.1 MFS transporter [Halorubrum sp. SP9]
MNWDYRHTVLTLCMLAFFVTYFARLAISPVVPLIIDDLGVSNTAIGVALSGMWFAYGLSQFPSGILADRYGERRIILVAVGGTTAMSLVLAVVPVFPAFVLAAVLLGLAAGLHYAVATTLLSRTFDDLGTAVGLHSMGGPLAGLVAPVAAAWVGVRYGWRPGVALAALVGVPIFVLFARGVRPTEPRRPDQPMAERLQLGPLLELVGRREILVPLAVATLGTYVAQGVISFLPTFLVEFRGYTPAFAGGVFSAFFVVRAGAQVGLGRLSDRAGRDASIAAALLGGALGLAGLVALPDLVRLPAAVGLPALPTVAGLGGAVFLAALGSSFFSAIDPRFMDALDDAERGAGFGLIRTVYTVLGSAGSVGVGLVADLFGWGASFAVIAGMAGVAFLVTAVNAIAGERR